MRGMIFSPRDINKFGITWLAPGKCGSKWISISFEIILQIVIINTSSEIGLQWVPYNSFDHYNDVIMSTMMSQITSLTIVYSTVYSGANQRKHQSSAPLAFVKGIHRRPVNSPHKWPITRKVFPFDDVIMVKSKLVQVMAWYHQATRHCLSKSWPRSMFPYGIMTPNMN